jgi:hypothetical protein
MRQPVPRSLKPVIESLQKSNDTTIGVEFVDDGRAENYLHTEFVADFSSPLQA